VLVIFVIVTAAALFIFGGYFFGGCGGTKKVDINVLGRCGAISSPRCRGRSGNLARFEAVDLLQFKTHFG